MLPARPGKMSIKPGSAHQGQTVGSEKEGATVMIYDSGSNDVRVDDEILYNTSKTVSNFADLTNDARAATEMEHKMTLTQAIKRYSKAIMFSMTLSLAVIMEGYDTSLLGSFYGLPQFRKRFGVELSDGDYQLTSSWQSGLQNGANVGEIAGLMIAGLLADRYGYKPTMLGALVMVIGAIFLLFFAKNIGMLFAGEILCGIPWGAFQTLTTTYAADITPIALRPILTTYVNMCWVIGQFISAGVLRGILSRSDNWAWRIPYAIQWAWPIPIIVGVMFAPESPWWLVRKGRIEDARNSLHRLTSRNEMHSDEINNTLQMMILTNEHEKQVEAGTTYWDCFKGTNFRRTEVSCCIWMIQVFCGIWYGGNVVYFLEQAGFNPTKAFDFGLGTNAIAIVGTMCSWFLIPRLGRRTLYLLGLIVMFTVLMTVGFMGIPGGNNSAIGWASGAFLIVFVFTYDLTVGPVCYCLVAEIPSTRLRVKTVVLARNAYNIASIVANFLNPPILNPSAWNLKGKGGFIWAAFCLLSLIWSYFRLPEPKGLTSAEIDVLFEQKISARKFRDRAVDPFRSANFDTTTFEQKE